MNKIIKDTSVAIPWKPKVLYGNEKMPDMGRWGVKAFDNDISTFGEVIKVLKTFCKYDEKHAAELAMRIDSLGKAFVYWGSEGECLLLAKALRNIFVKSEIVEWK